jgi:hypothetical protein
MGQREREITRAWFLHWGSRLESVWIGFFRLDDVGEWDLESSEMAYCLVYWGYRGRGVECILRFLFYRYGV